MHDLLYSYHDQSTILALSTSPLGNAAIAILRISGFSDLSNFYPILRFPRGPIGPLQEIHPQRSYYIKIQDNEQIYDTALLLFFKGPHSYTGENLLELHVHGNRLNVQRILSLLLKIPCKPSIRMALPGEFTLRAYKNKKMSLAQVEGLDLLMKARNYQVLHVAQNMLNGHLQEEFNLLREFFIQWKASLEILIDFSDDVGEEPGQRNFLQKKDQFYQKLLELKARIHSQSQSLINPQVLLFGPPNAGKSTLFNLLLGHDRANVSAIPGTTRDYLEEGVFWKNDLKALECHFNIIDSAGIRDTNDEIEQISIKKTKNLANKVFFKVYVHSLLELETFKSEEIKADIFIFTHLDKVNFKIPTFLELESYFLIGLEKYYYFSKEDGPIGPLPLRSTGPIGPSIEIKLAGSIEPPAAGPIEPPPSGPIGPTFIDKFASLILEKQQKNWNGGVILVERHIQLLTQSYDFMQRFETLVDFKADFLDLGHWSCELLELENILNELVGNSPVEEVLESIFRNFCIGK